MAKMHDCICSFYQIYQFFADLAKLAFLQNSQEQSHFTHCMCTLIKKFHHIIQSLKGKHTLTLIGLLKLFHFIFIEEFGELK